MGLYQDKTAGDIPELPIELEREILEWAARAHPTSVVSLALVAQRFRTWVEPIMYETVVLDLPLKTTTLFLRTLNSRPSSFFAQHVKNIYLTSIIPFHKAQRILSICTGATNIACWSDPGLASDGLIPLLHNRELKRLSTKVEALWRFGMMPPPLKLSCSMFANLSHIDIVNPPGFFLVTDWTWLHTLPALTHLAFGDLFATDHLYIIRVLSMVLARSELLQTLVAVSHDTSFIQELEQAGDWDPRLVLLPSFHHPKSLGDYWEGVRRGEPDFWGLADQLVMEAKMEAQRAKASYGKTPALLIDGP